MENIAVIIIGHQLDDVRVAEAYPAWECEDVESHVADAIVDWCGKYGTGNFKIVIRKLT